MQDMLLLCLSARDSATAKPCKACDAPTLASLKQCVSPHLKSILAVHAQDLCCVMQNDVGMFRVDAQQLKSALLPSPTALLAQLGQCLPRAAAQLYAAFVDQVHSATSILKASISSVEEYVQQLAFLETLKVRGLRTCISELSAAVVGNFTSSSRTMICIGTEFSAVHIVFCF